MTRDRIGACLLSLALLLVVAPGCGKKISPPPPADEPPNMPTTEPGEKGVPGPAEPAPADEPVPTTDETLTAETAELEPESPNVKLRVEVQPPGIKAQVWWGKKNLGVAPIQFERPRRSGPVDIVVKAIGFLNYHTRLFTDRNETLTVRMVPPQEVNTLLGYKHRPDGGVPMRDGGVPARDGGVRWGGPDGGVRRLPVDAGVLRR